MRLLDHYTEHGASVAAYTLNAGQYAPVFEHAALIATAKNRIAFWWMHDEKPHAFRVVSESEEGDEVTLVHAHGKLVVSPLPLFDDAVMRAWKRWTKEEGGSVSALLQQELKRVSATSTVRRVRPKPYRTMLQYVQADVGGDWALAGVWAADDEQIAYWGNPAMVHRTSFWQGIITTALESGGNSQAIFDYWLQSSEQLYRRTEGEKVEAASADEAAEWLGRKTLSVPQA